MSTWRRLRLALTGLLTVLPVLAGDPAGCADETGQALAVDQRGFPRAWNGRCDVGAYERVVLGYRQYIPLLANTYSPAHRGGAVLQNGGAISWRIP